MIIRPTRRKLILGAGASLAAPAIARAGVLPLLGAGKGGGGGGGGNPLWSLTVFQSGFEGTNGQGTSFLDDTGVWTLTRGGGNATLSSTQKEYGNTSAFTATTGQGWFTTPGSSAFSLSPNSNNDEYFFEFSVFVVSFGGNYDVYTIDRTDGASAVMWTRLNGDGTLRWLTSKVGSGFTVDITTTSNPMVAGVWTKWAIEKNSSGVIRIYKNGVMNGKGTPADSVTYSDSTLRLDVGQGFATVQNVYTDNLRILKGTGAAYVNSDAGYTPATSAFPIGP